MRNKNSETSREAVNMERQMQQTIKEKTESKPPIKTNWKFIAIVAFFTLVVGVAFIFLIPQLRIDKCLDRGGRWDYELSRCVGIITGNYYEVILYAYEKDGSHIFDSAVIAAIDENGEIVREQVADHDGKVVFSLPAGKYRFQPSPLKENRVAGTTELEINSDYTGNVLLTEVGPSSFGAPVDTCEEKYDAIESIFDTANYCTKDFDCKATQLGGSYIDFDCWKYIHEGYDTRNLYQRMDEYVDACAQKIDECAPSPLVVCRVGRCVQAQ